MMQCNNCGFGVNESMRFALMKNICPSCGYSLFSNKDSSILSMLQTKLKSERFSSSLTESQIYDISLFLFNEVRGGFFRQIVSEYARNAKDEDGDSESEYDESDDLNEIRKEVETEYSSELSSLDDDGDVLSEDVLSKADRLRKLHQQRVLANPTIGKETPITTNVRSGFKGISRST